MAIKLADTLKPMGDFPAAESSNVEITLTSGTKKTVQKAYEDGDLGGVINLTNQTFPDGVQTWLSASGKTDGYYETMCTTLSGKIMAFNYGSNEIHVSTDNGRTWSNSSGDVDGPKEASLVLPTTGRILVGSSNTLYISDDDGVTWRTVSLSKAVFALCLGLNGRIIAACYQVIQYSDDDGETWTTSTSSSSGTSTYFGVARAKNGNILAIGTSGIKVSSDNGITWSNTSVTSDQGFDLTVAKNGYVVSAYRNSSQGATDSPGLRYSDDNGLTWKNSNVTSGEYECLLTASDGTIFAGPFDSTTTMKYSVDNGVTWKDTSIPTGSRVHSFTEALDKTIIIGGNISDIHLKYSPTIYLMDWVQKVTN